MRETVIALSNFLRDSATLIGEEQRRGSKVEQ